MGLTSAHHAGVEVLADNRAGVEVVAAVVGVVVVAAAVQDMCLTRISAEAAEEESCLDDCHLADSEVDPARRRC